VYKQLSRFWCFLMRSFKYTYVLFDKQLCNNTRRIIKECFKRWRVHYTHEQLTPSPVIIIIIIYSQDLYDVWRHTSQRQTYRIMRLIRKFNYIGINVRASTLVSFHIRRNCTATNSFLSNIYKDVNATGFPRGSLAHLIFVARPYLSILFSRSGRDTTVIFSTEEKKTRVNENVFLFFFVFIFLFSYNLFDALRGIFYYRAQWFIFHSFIVCRGCAYIAVVYYIIIIVALCYGLIVKWVILRTYRYTDFERVTNTWNVDDNTRVWSSLKGMCLNHYS
jgi:hypothetical protein